MPSMQQELSKVLRKEYKQTEKPPRIGKRVLITSVQNTKAHLKSDNCEICGRTGQLVEKHDLILCPGCARH